METMGALEIDRPRSGHQVADPVEDRTAVVLDWLDGWTLVEWEPGDVEWLAWAELSPDPCPELWWCVRRDAEEIR